MKELIKANDTSLLNVDIDTDAQLIEQSIAKASTEDLKLALSQTVQITAKYITFLASIWRELENRNVDLSDLRSGIAYYLPMIADNKLDPSVVLAFAGQQLLLREISLMPLDKQVEYSEGAKIKLVEFINDDYCVSEVALKSLHSRHYNQVFDMGRIRSVEEQKQHIENLKKRRRKPKRKSSKVKAKKVKYSSDDDVISFDRTSVKFDDVLKAVSAKYGIETEDLELMLKEVADKT